MHKKLKIKAHERARKNFFKVRTRAHAHSKFSKDAHAHARGHENFEFI